MAKSQAWWCRTSCGKDGSPGHGYIISPQTQLPPALLPVIGSVSASQAVTLFPSMKSDILSQTSAVAHKRRGGEIGRHETMHAYCKKAASDPVKCRCSGSPRPCLLVSGLFVSTFPCGDVLGANPIRASGETGSVSFQSLENQCLWEHVEKVGSSQHHFEKSISCPLRHCHQCYSSLTASSWSLRFTTTVCIWSALSMVLHLLHL